MTNAQILAILRDEYGLKSTDYPDALLTKYITRAVKKISNYYPEVLLSYTTTVADQTRYTVSPTGLSKVRTVYYGHNEDFDNLFNDPDIPEQCGCNYPTIPLSTYFPSRQYSDIQNKNLLQQMNPIAADIVDYNAFDLIPTPDTTGTRVYYEYEKQRTITNTPDLFEEDVVNLVIWYMGQKAYVKDVSVQGGSAYNFDRRGNVQKQQQVATFMYQQRQTEMNDIVKEIQKKLMTMK